MKCLYIVILITLCCNGSNCSGVGHANFSGLSSSQLPHETRPINYIVTLNVNIHNGSLPFDGRVMVRVVADVATDVITLNSKGLSVNEARVFNKDESEVQQRGFELDAERDFIHINVDRPLTVGAEYLVQISYNGFISTSKNGFHRVAYRTADDDAIRFLAATKFEPNYLRSAIICYDEPSMKATFNLSITHHDSLHANANTEGFRLRNADGTITTTFTQSPVMSPGSLAFLISDFDSSYESTLHRNYARPDSRSAAFRSRFALKKADLASKELEQHSSMKGDYATDMDLLDDTEHNWRLPKSSVPNSYDLHLISNVHSGDLSVSGDVSIKLKVIETTDRLTLHSRNLTIDELTLFQADSINEIAIINFNLYTPTDMLTIYLRDNLTSGAELVLNVKYRFTMNDSPTRTGFYRTSYLSDSNEIRYLGATHLVHTYARGVMPCYDEPSLTATFKLAITHHESYQAVSNTAGGRKSNGDESVTTEFESTPPMATYLIGFVISDFNFTTNELSKEPEGTLHRISTRPNANKPTNHGLELSEKLLHILEEYLDAKYDLPKLDSVAVPGKDGPIVVWGLIAYTEDLIDFEVNFDETSHRHRYEQVVQIAHELVHQFFGNAIRIDQWAHLWLIEGFTSLLEYPIAGVLFEGWRDRGFMNLDRLQYVLTEDEVESPPAMSEPHIETIDEIESIFGPVAYYKAGSVLRMFQHAISPPIFQEALRRYLKTNHFQVVSPSNLYESFEAVLAEHNINDFNFTEAFQTWEVQKGYPVIHVKHVSEQKHFLVTQKKYFVDPSLKDELNSTWTIPLNYATSDNPNFDDTTITHYFDHNSNQKTIPLDSNKPEWFVFNKQQLGYYRVNYDAENWRNIIEVLNGENYSDIHVLNRALLVDDAMSFARAGLINYDLASGILMYLRHESDYIPWASASIYLDELTDLFGGMNEDINKFINLLSERLYAAYPFDDSKIYDESIVDRFTREMAIKWACKSGNTKCLDDTFAKFILITNHTWSLPKGLEEVVYCSGLSGQGTRDGWISLWQKMLASNDFKERNVIIGALGCSKDVLLLTDWLHTSIATNSDNNYITAERLKIFKSVVARSDGLKAAIEFLENYEQDIEATYQTSIAEVLEIAAENVRDWTDLTLFVTYVMSNENLSSELVETLKMKASEKLSQQNTSGVQDLVKALRLIVVSWEEEEGSTNAPVTTDSTTTGMAASPFAFKSLLLMISLLMLGLFK